MKYIDIDRVWYDGLGNQMKKGTYSQNEVDLHSDECVHILSDKIVEIFFFAGGYYHKMKECTKCHSMISVDMEDHPTGSHIFSEVKEGLRCNYCTLTIIGGPIMNIRRII